MSKLAPLVHRVAKLELLCKFLYFLIDLDIKSARPASKDIWLEYMKVQTEITLLHDVLQT